MGDGFRQVSVLGKCVTRFLKWTALPIIFYLGKSSQVYSWVETKLLNALQLYISVSIQDRTTKIRAIFYLGPSKKLGSRIFYIYRTSMKQNQASIKPLCPVIRHKLLWCPRIGKMIFRQMDPYLKPFCTAMTSTAPHLSFPWALWGSYLMQLILL